MLLGRSWDISVYSNTEDNLVLVFTLRIGSIVGGVLCVCLVRYCVLVVLSRLLIHDSRLCTSCNSLVRVFVLVVLGYI
jgi:hypothetical protein